MIKILWNMQNILLIGAHGQVGQELIPQLSSQGALTAVGRSNLDLTDVTQIQSVIEAVKPDIIVNAAAYTAVDKAESDVDTAHQVNTVAPTEMAKVAQSLGALLVHISTDYVFDGQKGSPYLETDPTQPIGVYGQTKRAGELGVIEACDRHIILRTAWVYGAKGQSNFVKTMLRLGKDRDSLSVVMDQIGTPTWSQDIALAIADLLKTLAAQTIPNGIYHFTNSGVASWYDFAIAIFEEARALGFALQIQEVVPITTAEYPTPAQRPAYSVLGLQKINQVLDRNAPHWRSSLRLMLQELKQMGGG